MVAPLTECVYSTVNRFNHTAAPAAASDPQINHWQTLTLVRVSCRCVVHAPKHNVNSRLHRTTRCGFAWCRAAAPLVQRRTLAGVFIHACICCETGNVRTFDKQVHNATATPTRRGAPPNSNLCGCNLCDRSDLISACVCVHAHSRRDRTSSMAFTVVRRRSVPMLCNIY